VIDGDTLELSTGERIRLWGIDAPEGDQICQRNGRPWRCGDDATAALEALVNGRALKCEARDVDRYGRTVATCTVAGQDVGAAMVLQGWALDYERFSGGAYADEQLEAEQAQRGLWSGSFMQPWEWRRR
jgi:endonuclease YncB( thermonuclease family)